MAHYPDEYIQLCYRLAVLDVAIVELDDLAPDDTSSLLDRPNIYTDRLPKDISQVSADALLEVLMFLREEYERTQQRIEEYTVVHRNDLPSTTPPEKETTEDE